MNTNIALHSQAIRIKPDELSVMLKTLIVKKYSETKESSCSEKISHEKEALRGDIVDSSFASNLVIKTNKKRVTIPHLSNTPILDINHENSPELMVLASTTRLSKPS